MKYSNENEIHSSRFNFPAILCDGTFIVLDKLVDNCYKYHFIILSVDKLSYNLK